MCVMISNDIQYASWAMYAVFEQQFEGEYQCARFVHVARLDLQ